MPIKRKKRFSLKLLGIFSLIFFLWGLSPLYAESLESMAVRAETIVVSVTKKKGLLLGWRHHPNPSNPRH